MPCTRMLSVDLLSLSKSAFDCATAAVVTARVVSAKSRFKLKFIGSPVVVVVVVVVCSNLARAIAVRAGAHGGRPADSEHLEQAKIDSGPDISPGRGPPSPHRLGHCPCEQTTYEPPTDIR